MLLRLVLLLGCLAATGDAVPLDARRTQSNHWIARQTKRSTSSSSSSAASVALQLRGGGIEVEHPVGAFLNAVDLFGTGVFAFSGALTAGKKGMDLIGMIIVAAATAVGGGTVRDMLLGSGAVFWMRVPIYFEICAVVAVGTYYIWPMLEKHLGLNDSAKAICTADAFGLGAFAVLGTQKGKDMGLNPVLSVVAGMISSTFGGITRDVFCQQPPRIMYPHRSLYGIHPLIGSIVYSTLTAYFGVLQEQAAVISFLLTFTTRVLSFNSPRRLPHWKN
jgi:uncharacterized membrane protein YeiH